MSKPWTPPPCPRTAPQRRNHLFPAAAAHHSEPIPPDDGGAIHRVMGGRGCTAGQRPGKRNPPPECCPACRETAPERRPVPLVVVVVAVGLEAHGFFFDLVG